MRIWPKNEIHSSLLAAALLVFVLGQRGAGFMVFFVAFALLIWIPYSAYVMVKKPEIRASQLARLCIWVLVVPLLFGIHYIRQKITRRHADEIVAAIDGYSRTHGHYPATLEEIGISRKRLKDRLGFSAYFFNAGKPDFFYHGTFTPYAMCRYDFNAGAWRCRPD
jgi:hypothetical protein